MENIIILILFTYPGAFAEYIYHQLASKKSFLKKPDEIFRVARDFFISVFVTLCSLFFVNLFLGTDYSLSSLVTALPRGYLLWIYCAISLVGSGIAGLLWYGIVYLSFYLKNQKMIKETGTFVSVKKTTWDGFLHAHGAPIKDCIVAIYQNGNLIRAGLTKEITNNPEDDPGIILMFSSTVEGDLKRAPDKRVLIGEAIISYMNIQTGIEVAIYDGKKMAEYIKSFLPEDSSPEVVEAAKKA